MNQAVARYAGGVRVRARQHVPAGVGEHLMEAQRVPISLESPFTHRTSSAGPATVDGKCRFNAFGWVVGEQGRIRGLEEPAVFERKLVPVSLEAAVSGAECRGEGDILFDEQRDQLLGLRLVHLGVQVGLVSRVVFARDRHPCDRAADAGRMRQVACAEHCSLARS